MKRVRLESGASSCCALASTTRRDATRRAGFVSLRSDHNGVASLTEGGLASCGDPRFASRFSLSLSLPLSRDRRGTAELGDTLASPSVARKKSRTIPRVTKGERANREISRTDVYTYRAGTLYANASLSREGRRAH